MAKRTEVHQTRISVDYLIQAIGRSIAKGRRQDLISTDGKYLSNAEALAHLEALKKAGIDFLPTSPPEADIEVPRLLEET